jgi:hypothetical protein
MVPSTTGLDLLAQGYDCREGFEVVGTANPAPTSAFSSCAFWTILGSCLG